MIIEHTGESKLDTAEIWCFIAQDSVDHADKWVDEIDAVIRMLAAHPLAGRARPDLAKNVRSFPHGNYLVIYRPISNGIRILRVLHGARNLRRQFNDDL